MCLKERALWKLSKHTEGGQMDGAEEALGWLHNLLSKAGQV